MGPRQSQKSIAGMHARGCHHARWWPHLRLAEPHHMRFHVMAGQALKYAPVLTLSF
jgi:hypothetical protein